MSYITSAPVKAGATAAAVALSALLFGCTDPDEEGTVTDSPRATVAAETAPPATDPPPTDPPVTEPPATDPPPTTEADVGPTAFEIAGTHFVTMANDADELSVLLTDMDIAGAERKTGEIVDDFVELEEELQGASDIDTPEGQRVLQAAQVCGDAFADLEAGLAAVDIDGIEAAGVKVETCTSQIDGLTP